MHGERRTANGKYEGCGCECVVAKNVNIVLPLERRDPHSLARVLRFGSLEEHLLEAHLARGGLRGRDPLRGRARRLLRG